MVLPATASSPGSAQLIQQLGDLCRSRGLPDLAARLIDLQRWVESDLGNFESELATIRRGPRAVQRAAHHLLDLGGKYLRPMCVALAAKMGTGFGGPARQLAVAVELVHSATLLHDDVVDLGDTRRGAPGPRAWSTATRRRSLPATGCSSKRCAGFARRACPEILDFTLTIINEMILAESLQLERRGDLRASVDEYFQVVEGKTAALFRWAMVAGGRAGQLDDTLCRRARALRSAPGRGFPGRGRLPRFRRRRPVHRQGPVDRSPRG